MLNSLGTSRHFGETNTAQLNCAPKEENKYLRNEEADMQKALGYLYDFKKKLDELHPHCITLIEQMLQRPINRY
jgi:hypothetical protein